VRWFVDITSWEPIAMDMRQLVRAFDAGRIDADTLVWRKGMPDWRRLRDISELAERLVGAGAEASEKVASEPPPTDLAQSGSEPPPRQSERSRTPPASYTVGSRSGSEPPVASPAAGAQGSSEASSASNQSTASSGSVPPTADAAERASVAPADDASGNALPSRRSTPGASPRPHSRRGRGKTPSRPNASLAPVPSRTVTQTGLESPAEVTARSSILPPAGPAGAAASGSEARTRDSRTSAAPPGARRQASSDETPAQKPSSLSVPPGAIIEGRSRPRSRRFLALAAVLLGGAILIRQVATSGDDTAVAADEDRVEAVPAPAEVEKSPGPARKAAGQPAAAGSAHDIPSPMAAPAGEPRTAAAAEAVAAGPSRAAPGASAAPGAPGPLPAGPASAPLNVEASAKETLGLTSPVAEAPKVAAPAAPSAAPLPAPKPPSPAPAAAPPPRPAPPAVAANPPVPVAKPAAPAVAANPPVPVAKPAAPNPPPPVEPAPAPAAREPRPFDELLATQQFEAAVAKAAACGQQGATRGTGRVKVAIEPWGRVGRVTHLNQDFVGTPVGVCVMQAFQEIRLPPFDGNSRSIAGEFVVE
jgi:hypothetical protein